MSAWGYTTPIRKGRQPSWQSTPWRPGTKPKKEETKDKGYKFTGYDGRSTSLPSSSASHGEQTTTSSSEVTQLKDMIRQMASCSSVPLTAEQQKILTVSPGERLKKDQKALNAERKRYNKQRNLEAKLEENLRRFNAWKIFVKSEKERFEEDQMKLQQQLEALNKEEEQDEELMEEDIEDILGEPSDPTKKEMEERIQAAEKNAFEAQQALLMMNSQMQQLMACQMSVQASPMVPQPGVTMLPQATPGGTSPMLKANSPQLPKGVRKENLKQVQKANGPKAKDATKEDLPKVDPAAEATAPKEVITVEDEQDAALL